MNSVRRSFLLSFAESYAGIALQLASTVIIARVLTPSELGVFAIAAVFSMLASSFRDFGMGEYLIQERNLTTEKLRAAMSVNTIVSWTMAATLLAAAPLAAAFYREQGVASVMRVLSLSFLVIPFGAVVQYWFRRELNYKPLAICNILSNLTAFAVAVVLALRGHSYMSLAWSVFAGVIVSVLGALYFRPTDFPRTPGLKGMAEVFHFGKYASGTYILAQVGRGLPEMIIGRVSGTAEVGIFSRASSLVELMRRLLLRPALQVCLPYFAKASRDEGDVAPAYEKSVGLLTAVGWPALAALALASFAVIRIIYGEQWLDAVPLARVLCLFCAFELVFLLGREALLARGEVKRASVLQLEILSLQIGGLSLAVPYGPEGAAWGLVLSAVAGIVLTQRHLHRAIGLRSVALAAACAPSALVTVWTIAPLGLAAYLAPIGEENYLLWAISASVAGPVLWVLGLRLLKHPLWHEIERALERFLKPTPAK